MSESLVAPAVALGLLLAMVWPAAAGIRPAPSRTPASSPQEQAPDVQASWDRLLRDIIPEAEPDPALIVEQDPVVRRAGADFLTHFFFQSNTEYRREEISFTGLPTRAGVFDGTQGLFFDPRGIPRREAFQPNTDSIYQFMNLGTRGWLSSRVNTNFSLRFRQNLSHVERGSPAQTILDTFGARRRTEVLSATVEIQGLSTDGAFAGTSLRLGRQYVYGAELAAFDGASFTVNRHQFSLTVFGGRRFTYYSDPEQRAIGGATITFPLGDSASIEYGALGC